MEFHEPEVLSAKCTAFKVDGIHKANKKNYFGSFNMQFILHNFTLFHFTSLSQRLDLI